MSRLTLTTRAASSLSLRGEGGGEGRTAPRRAGFARADGGHNSRARRNNTDRRFTFLPSPQPFPRWGEGARSAFTLVEVLAALLLIAIVLPVVMQGISLATNAASDARRRTEAAGLAESKLDEVVATRQWLAGSLSGDFTPDWPDYRWEASLQPYANDSSGKSVQQIDLRVIWTARNREQSVSVSTLAYARTTATSE